MLDDTIKTILVDESLTVVRLVDSVCARIGGSPFPFCDTRNDLGLIFRNTLINISFFSFFLFFFSKGITNPDEYSFTTEANEAKAARPQDLKKSKTQDKLLDSKAKTAESNPSIPANNDKKKKSTAEPSHFFLCFCFCLFIAIWLNPDKSLREQGVEENEVIVLKKKFFFSDQNIDRTDPIQLNLLYVQVKDQRQRQTNKHKQAKTKPKH